jgi:fermentation-respiration switch protein FrsA (DUF1100 family)
MAATMKGRAMSRYKTLRTWSFFLLGLGVLSIVSATFGVISWAIAVEGGWETLGVLLFGGPIALLLAAWPIAVGQALRAIADIGDAVVDGSVTSLPRQPAARF